MTHYFLCKKSHYYNIWHKHPHHKKIHWAVLIIYIFSIAAGIISNIPLKSKAANSFMANYDSSSLNADSAAGSTSASNDGTPANLVSPGFGGTGQAAQLTNGKTLKYDTANNLSNTEGTISMQVKYPGVLSGDWDGGFYNPKGIFYQSSTDLIYTVDTSNNRIIVVKSDGVTGWSSFGSMGTDDGQLSNPYGIWVDSGGLVYVAETGNHRIQIFNNAANSYTPLGWIGKDTLGGSGWHAAGSGKTPSSGNSDGQLNSPYGISIDSNGRIYVVDSGNSRVQIFNNAANSHASLGWIGKDSLGGSGWHAVGSGKTPATGTLDGQFNGPIGLTLGSTDKIYVVDRNSNRIQVFDNAVASYATLGWIGKDTLGGIGWHAVGSGKVPSSGSSDVT